jgi:hypothetical protein
MSNEKVAATFHGEGDPALASTIEAAEIRGYACGMADAKYHKRPEAADWNAARRWATNYGYRSQQHPKAEPVVPGPYAELNRKRSFNPEAVPAVGPNWCCWMGRHTNGADHVRMCEHHRGTPETTGEHTLAKLADNPYGGVTGEEALSRLRHRNRLRSLAAHDSFTPSVRRGWTPTSREILTAVGFLLVILGVVLWVVDQRPM